MDSVVVVKLASNGRIHTATIDANNSTVSQKQLGKALVMWMLMCIYETSDGSYRPMNYSFTAKGNTICKDMDMDGDVITIARVTSNTIDVWNQGEFITFHYRADEQGMENSLGTILELLNTEYDFNITAEFSETGLECTTVVFDGQVKAISGEIQLL